MSNRHSVYETARYKATTDDVPNAKAVFPRNGSMADESHGIMLLHPTLGWCPITVVSDGEFAVSTASHHIWFSLDDQEVSTWQVSKATDFMKWIRRVSRTV